MDTKTCSKCKKELPINMFNKNKQKKDGLACYCKSCLKEYIKTYRENNKNDLIKKAKEYYYYKEIMDLLKIPSKDVDKLVKTLRWYTEGYKGTDIVISCMGGCLYNDYDSK